MSIGLAFQISLQYASIVRSNENLPIRAAFSKRPSGMTVQRASRNGLRLGHCPCANSSPRLVRANKKGENAQTSGQMGKTCDDGFWKFNSLACGAPRFSAAGHCRKSPVFRPPPTSAVRARTIPLCRSAFGGIVNVCDSHASIE